MVIFNSYVKLTEGIYILYYNWIQSLMENILDQNTTRSWSRLTAATTICSWGSHHIPSLSLATPPRWPRCPLQIWYLFQFKEHGTSMEHKYKGDFPAIKSSVCPKMVDTPKIASGVVLNHRWRSTNLFWVPYGAIFSDTHINVWQVWISHIFDMFKSWTINICGYFMGSGVWPISKVDCTPSYSNLPFHPFWSHFELWALKGSPNKNKPKNVTLNCQAEHHRWCSYWT